MGHIFLWALFVLLISVGKLLFLKKKSQLVNILVFAGHIQSCSLYLVFSSPSPSLTTLWKCKNKKVLMQVVYKKRPRVRVLGFAPPNQFYINGGWGREGGLHHLGREHLGSTLMQSTSLRFWFLKRSFSSNQSPKNTQISLSLFWSRKWSVSCSYFTEWNWS